MTKDATPVNPPSVSSDANGPQLPQCVWSGLAGEYLDIVKECTEAPDEFHLAGFLTAVGCLMGRRAWFRNPHPTYSNFYSLLVGDTALARKSTAYAFAVNLLRDGGELLGRSEPPEQR